MELVKQAFAPMKKNTIRIIVRKDKRVTILEGKLNEGGIVENFRACVNFAFEEIQKNITAKLKKAIEPKSV